MTEPHQTCQATYSSRAALAKPSDGDCSVNATFTPYCDFLTCHNPANRHHRTESERFKSFSYDDLIKREKANLDHFWLKFDSL